MRLIKKRIFTLLLAGAILCLSACGRVEKDESVPIGIGRDEVTATGTETDAEDTGDGTVGPVETDGPVEPDETRISIAAVGDNLIHESVYKTAAVHAAAMDGYEGDYYFTGMYSEELQHIIASADIAFVNQEAPIVPDMPVAAYPNFNTPTEAADALIEIGFDVVNLANNHMLDMEGKGEGLRATIDFWKTREILPIGAYESIEDYNTVRVMEVEGKRIAFLSYTYGTNGNALNWQSGDLVVPYINDGDITRQVTHAAEVADAVVVSMHWGSENTNAESGEQNRLAKLLADCGADVVIGHHSHTLQPVEWVTGQTGERTLVIYSLGNFISSQMKYYNMVGGIATFDLVFDETGVTVEAPLLIPTMTHYVADAGVIDSLGLPTRTQVSVGLLESYTEEMCQSHGAQLPSLNGPFTLASVRGYVTSTVSAEFLPDYLK